MTGPSPYEESNVSRLRIGRHHFQTTGQTARCTLPNTDDIVLGLGEGPKFRQDSVIVEKQLANGYANGHANGSANGHAVQQPRPFLDLHELDDPYMAQKPVLGMQMVPERKTQEALNGIWFVSVGDEIEVLQRSKGENGHA